MARSDGAIIYQVWWFSVDIWCITWCFVVAQDYHAMIAGPASTLAHEMGHNFGFDHDEDITPCACDDPSCIMSAVIRSVRLANLFRCHFFRPWSSNFFWFCPLRFSERELMFTFAICYRPSVCRPSVVCLSSVVCNVRAPYSGGSNFRQYLYGIRYLGHPLTSTENSRRSSQRNPSAGGVKHKRVVKYSDFGPIDGYISETLQDRR